MKLIHLKNLKRECVLVELDKGDTDPEYFSIRENKYIRYWSKGKDYLIDIDQNVVLLGHFPSLTEDQLGELVYIEYHRDASESFISAIEAEGWYTENPITNPYEQFHWCEEWKQNAIKYYNEAQEKVINLSNCYLFFKS